MRPVLALTPLVLLLALPAVLQEPEGEGPGDEEAAPEDEDANTFTSLFERERERLEEAVQGTWMLQQYNPAEAVFDPENVRGVAIFREGFLSVTIMAQTFRPEFLGDGGQLWVQGGSYRYRISEFLELQTATIVGFDNYEDVDEMEVELEGAAREYRLDVEADGATLRMTAENGAELIWSRLTESALPEETIDVLDATRGGR